MLQILNTALVALRRNVARSLLTMLGIVIGIAAVITMMEIGDGAAKQVSRRNVLQVVMLGRELPRDRSLPRTRGPQQNHNVHAGNYTKICAVMG